MPNMQQPAERPIYLDYHATTPVDPRVAAAVLDAMITEFGNANSVEHLYGEVAARLVEDARFEVANLVSAEPEGVHFTSGSTEAIQLALAHALATHKRPLRVALTTVEHRALLDRVVDHERGGDIALSWLPVDQFARLDLDALEKTCQEGVDLVCVMAANNEVGTIYPIEAVNSIAAKAGASILVDATQAAGRIPLDALSLGITYLTISAHKIYGPKGIGALIVPPELHIRPDHGRIAGTGDGTPNVSGIVGLGEACRLRRLEMDFDEPRIANQRNTLEKLLHDSVECLATNGDPKNRLSGNLHISVPGVPNDVIVTKLRHLVALSTGAACSSGAQTRSHVLMAMRLPEAIQVGALRIGLGKFTTDEEIDLAATYISQASRAAQRSSDVWRQ